MSDPLAAFLYVRGLVPEDMPLEDIRARGMLLKECLVKLITDLDEVGDDSTEQEIQSVFYEAGKLHFLSELRWWFRVIYQMILHQEDGPRLGQLTKIMTLDWIIHKLQTQTQDAWQHV